MGDEISDENLHVHDDREAEAVETLSLTDFPIAQDHGVSTVEDHRSPPRSTATEDFFEFFRGGFSDNSDDNSMSHAEDIIFCGKLLPINEQLHRNESPQTTKQTNNKIPLITELLVGFNKDEKRTNMSSVPERREAASTDTDKRQQRNQQNQPNKPVGCRRSRSEPMAELKRTTVSPPVRTSRSVDYKRLNRNSSMSSDFAAEINREGSGKKSLSTSSRWYVLLFGLVKVPPPEMDIRDIKNRQVRRTTSKTPPGGSELVPVSQSVDHRKCSWRVLGFLSCKSSSCTAVTTPVGYMAKV